MAQLKELTAQRSINKLNKGSLDTFSSKAVYHHGDRSGMSFWTWVFLWCRSVFTFTKSCGTYVVFSSYNAIKAYKKEGKMESLSASEHLVSAAEAGEVKCKD